jgi:hypothetical protein
MAYELQMNCLSVAPQGTWHVIKENTFYDEENTLFLYTYLIYLENRRLSAPAYTHAIHTYAIHTYAILADAHKHTHSYACERGANAR